MRTTLTLEPDVALLLEEEMHRARKSFKSVVNEALRRGLSRAAPPRKLPTYRAPVHSARLRPGFDPASFNSLADELEDAEILRKPGRPGRSS